jgi:arylsulfatase A-like enzyme/cytochrome c-type biogenesis protein CcmH/NrfG
MKGGFLRGSPFVMYRLLFTACALAAAAALQPQAARPNVLLITLDTTRADRMGFLGSTRGLTPSMDALAKTATVFERAYAQAPITTVSHATILSGTYPPFHRVDDFGAPLSASVPYFPDLLKSSGYETAAFVGSLILDPRNGTAPGFDRGFDVYDAGLRLRRPGEDRYATVERRGDEVTRRALAWVSSPQRRSPFFLWVHLFDPHDPYEPPADLQARFSKEPYDGEVAFTDRQVGRLISAAGGNTTIVVAADHGEALGDHGETTHGVFLYEATQRVPLILRLTGGRGAGMRISTRVRLADVAPTILESAGLPVPSAMQGQSLLPLTLAASKADDRPVYAESSYPRRAFGWSPLVSWRADRFLYVRAPKRELYDLVADPEAARNLALSRTRLADGLDGEMAQFLGRSATGASSQARVDPAVAERLAALGYVGGSSGTPRATGVDPKDRIAIANTLHDAIVAVEDGAFARAVPLLEKVVAGEPDIPIAQLNLGVARARQKQFARAVAPLRRAATLQPDNMRGHYELGLALYETGDVKGAAGELAVVATALPQWADARYSLGSVYARIDRVADAMTELRAALALEPRHFRANLLYGRLLSLTGKAAEAVPYLQTAVDVDPKSTEARQFLTDALRKK